MDQDAFRSTYREVNERFCAFEKSILTNQCQCSQAEKFCIAEREGVHCKIDAGQGRCLKILDILRHQARFALKTNDQNSKILPHGKAIRVQVGGMRGIKHVTLPELSANEIDDIDAILLAALEKHGNFDALPFFEIMPFIAAYESRKRSRRRD